MVVDKEELLLRMALNKVCQCTSFCRVCCRCKHEIDEENVICLVNLIKSIEIEPRLVILRTVRIDDDVDFERLHLSEVATRLLGYDVAIGVGMLPITRARLLMTDIPFS